MSDINLLNKGLDELGIALNDDQKNKFLLYFDLLIESNKVMNLTAITDYEEVVTKHFIDSLSLVKAIDLSKPYRILDLGTGAGFPGIPLKIAFPHLNILLVDSLNKRIKFLNETIQKLGLTDIVAIHSRAEDLARDIKYRENFDLCVSRAVANLSTLSEYCLPFVKIGGYFIPYKSGKVLEEIDVSTKAIKLFGGEIKRIESFMLPGTDNERSLVLIFKRQATPKIYPRNSGKPSKEPIIN